MKRKYILIPIILYFGLLPIIAAQAQEDMQFVDNTVFEKPKRPPARFEHDNHNDISGIEECNTCHHVYADGRLVEDDSSEDQSCSDCHGIDPAGNRPSLRRAFHLNCKGCHQQQGAGPVMCAECHQKPRPLNAAAGGAHQPKPDPQP